MLRLVPAATLATILPSRRRTRRAAKEAVRGRHEGPGGRLAAVRRRRAGTDGRRRARSPFAVGAAPPTFWAFAGAAAFAPPVDQGTSASGRARASGPERRHTPRPPRKTAAEQIPHKARRRFRGPAAAAAAAGAFPFGGGSAMRNLNEASALARVAMGEERSPQRLGWLPSTCDARRRGTMDQGIDVVFEAAMTGFV